MTGPENLTRWVWKELRKAFHWPGINLRGLEEHFERVVIDGVRGLREHLAGSLMGAVEAAKRLVERAEHSAAKALERLPW